MTPDQGLVLTAAVGAAASLLLAFNIWKGDLALAALNLLLVAAAAILIFKWGYVAGLRAR